MPDSARLGEQVFRGIPVSPGVSRGTILVLGQPDDTVSRLELPDDQLPLQLQRLEQALAQTRKQILEVQKQVSQAMGAGDATIFDAHLLLLEDPTLIEEVSKMILSEKVNVEWAFKSVADRYAATLSSIEDDYLRERATDMRDVASRVLDILLGRKEQIDLGSLETPCIIISHDLTPSTTALLDKKRVLGFATDIGSRTSHTAIMARSLGLPAVVGLGNASKAILGAKYGLLDGYNGLVIVNPSDQTLFDYGQLVRRRVTLKDKLLEEKDRPSVTLDNHPIILSANVERIDDTDAVTECGAKGVGLFRTEYLFINRDRLPDEEEQYQAYRLVAEALNPEPVVIRTLDLGGDKFLSHLQVPLEMNPFLGWRAIRFCLQEMEIFRNQIRAILRASAHGNVKMMYPMISNVEELDQANALCEQCKGELHQEGLAFDHKIEVGVMIEIPSAVHIADALASRVSFFSIGTNDLIQYTLAVDRLNEKIAHLYEPTHPAILQLIKMTVDAAHRHGIWVGVCGEMAGDPVMTPLLLGLGVDELSVAPPCVPEIKYLIRHINLANAQAFANSVLKAESAKSILTQARDYARAIAPNIIENQPH